MKCPQGGTRMQSRIEGRYGAGIEGASITLLGVEAHRCPRCGEEAFGIKNMVRLNRRIAQELVSKTARLSPAEIRLLRLHLGLTVTELAARMGVSRSAASRWESATKPLALRAPPEQLLRLMVAVERRRACPSWASARRRRSECVSG